MKLNNKGMSIIEIVVTFALIMVMVIQMLTIVMNYREKASSDLKELDLKTFKDTLTRDIQKDILNLGVKEINTGGECGSNTKLNQCINIVFNNGSEKAFGTSKIDSSNINSIENKYLYYDGLKYKLSDNLPDEIPTGRDILDFQSIKVEDNNILSTDSIVLDDGTKTTVYSIDVYISHVNFDQDFGIHIVAAAGENIEISGQLLRLAVFEDNKLITATPTLTTSSNNSSDASGLYKSTATNNGNATYYFRGNVENNYVEFAKQLWRIVRINEDGTIRIIKQVSIGTGNLSSTDPGVNYNKMYYTNTSAKTTINNWYNSNLINFTNYIATGNYFCEQAKVKMGDNYTSGDATMITYSNYKPDFKCTSDGNGHGLLNLNIGLITYDELVYAGGYNLKTNSEFYLSYMNNAGTMSPGGVNGTWETTWAANTTGPTGSIGYSLGSTNIFPVINLKSSTIVTGSGIETDPYKVL